MNWECLITLTQSGTRFAELDDFADKDLEQEDDPGEAGPEGDKPAEAEKESEGEESGEFDDADDWDDDWDDDADSESEPVFDLYRGIEGWPRRWPPIPYWRRPRYRFSVM